MFYGFRDPTDMNNTIVKIISEKYNGVYKLPGDSNLRTFEHYDTITVTEDNKLRFGGVTPKGEVVSQIISDDLYDWMTRSLEIYECLTQTEEGKSRNFTKPFKMKNDDVIDCSRYEHLKK